MQKTLALFGLLIVIVAIAFLAVQLVKVFPTALTTLANVAGSVYNQNPASTREFSINPNRTIVNTSDVYTASWDKLPLAGSYSFTFTCTDGVAIDIKTSSNIFSSATCGQAYNLGDVGLIELTVNSEKKRFSEVPYTISFFQTNDVTPSAASASTFTVINPNISSPTIGLAPDISSSTINTEATSTPEIATTTPIIIVVATTTAPAAAPVATSTRPVPVAVVTPSIPPTVTPTPVVVPVYTYAIPVSQPNGFTDLVVTYLGIGMVNNAGQFIKTDTVRSMQPGAFQFSVHNLGTRTSGPWSFVTQSPDGNTFTSGNQVALKPNERSILTVNFNAFSSNTLARLSAEVTTNRDINSSNNRFINNVVVIR